ncbi:MAG: PH domain-containing protein [Phycisphaerales bacterium]
MSATAPATTVASLSTRGFDPLAITRPHESLRTYYVVCSIFAGPFFFLPLIPLLFKFHTLRYRFDEEGISMSWGVLMRREIVLTYRRIQDIHVRRNIIQRWLGLATVSIQTASGSSSPEMSIEGVLEADALRDFLYSRMRGARGEGQGSAGAAAGRPAAEGEEDILGVLRDIRDSLRLAAARIGPAGGDAERRP